MVVDAQNDGLDDRFCTMLEDEDHALVAAVAKESKRLEPAPKWGEGKGFGKWKGAKGKFDEIPTGKGKPWQKDGDDDGQKKESQGKGGKPRENQRKLEKTKEHHNNKSKENRRERRTDQRNTKENVDR